MVKKSKFILFIGAALFTSNIVAADNINELLEFDKAMLSCQKGNLNMTAVGKNKISTQWVVGNQCGFVHCKDNSTFTINDKTISTKQLKKIIDNNYKNFAVSEYERQNKSHSTIPTIDLSAMKSTIEKSVVFEEGKTAYLSGKDKKSNPYLTSENEKQWLDGWITESECSSDVSLVSQ